MVSAHAALLAERAARLQAEAEAANAVRLSSIEALNAHLQLLLGKLEREKHGPRRERTQRLIDQLECGRLEGDVATVAEDELGAPEAALQRSPCAPLLAKRRAPWPEDVERERIVIEAPTACACRGGSRLPKLGEDVTETLEEIPRRFKVIETVREKFTCRDCEAISQAPALFHATPRGFIGPQLLGLRSRIRQIRQAIPLNRQSTRFKCEGIDLSTQTLADQVGHVTFALPIFDLIEAHVFQAGERLHGDDMTILIPPRPRIDWGEYIYVRAGTTSSAGPAPAGGGLLRLLRSGAGAFRKGIWPHSSSDCRGYNGFNPLFDRTKRQM